MTSRYSSPDFWVEACDRAVKCAAAGFVAAVGTNAVGLTNVDWVEGLNISALAGLVSLLASVAGAPRVP